MLEATALSLLASHPNESHLNIPRDFPRRSPW